MWGLDFSLCHVWQHSNITVGSNTLSQNSSKLLYISTWNHWGNNQQTNWAAANMSKIIQPETKKTRRTCGGFKQQQPPHKPLTPLCSCRSTFIIQHVFFSSCKHWPKVTEPSFQPRQHVIVPMVYSGSHGPEGQTGNLTSDPLQHHNTCTILKTTTTVVRHVACVCVSGGGGGVVSLTQPLPWCDYRSVNIWQSDQCGRSHEPTHVYLQLLLPHSEPNMLLTFAADRNKAFEQCGVQPVPLSQSLSLGTNVCKKCESRVCFVAPTCPSRFINADPSTAPGSKATINAGEAREKAPGWGERVVS